MEPINRKTGMTQAEARAFIRNHFEEFVNKKNVQIGMSTLRPTLSTAAPMCRLERRQAQRERFNMWPGR
jgi:hypothetical protein